MVRIEFIFPKALMSISHYSADDPILKVYFLPAENVNLSWLIGKSAMSIAQWIKVYRKSQGQSKDYRLDAVIDYLQSNTAIFDKSPIQQMSEYEEMEDKLTPDERRELHQSKWLPSK